MAMSYFVSLVRVEKNIVSNSQADTSGQEKKVFTKICIIGAQNLGPGVRPVLRQAVTL